MSKIPYLVDIIAFYGIITNICIFIHKKMKNLRIFVLVLYLWEISSV